MLGYSLFTLLDAYAENKDVIEAYIKNQSIEGYRYAIVNDNGSVNPTDAPLVMGMGIGLFIILLILTIGMWLWAIIALVTYWDKLPSWAQIVGILGIVSGIGPLVTIIVVYIAKKK